jgi:hypothetical protein
MSLELTTGTGTNSYSTLSTISTLFADISELSTNSMLMSTLIKDLSGNLSLLSTVISDISGATTPAEVLTNLSVLIEPQPPPPPPILSIEELMNTSDFELQKEREDKVIINAAVNPGYDKLKNMLKPWAKAGFEPGFELTSFNIIVPPVCADGAYRPLPYYFEYLLGVTIATALENMAANTTGMRFSFSHDGNSKITIHVTKC